MKKIVNCVLIAIEIAALAAMVFCAEHRVACGIVAAVLLLILLLSLRGGRNVPPAHGPAEPKSPPEPPVEPGPTVTPPKGDEKTSYFEMYLEYVSDKHGKSAADRVKNDVCAILGTDTNGRIDEVISRPDSKNRAKGIVVGRVQSGKTQNYTGLITRAIDEGWNVIIILTSSNTALKSQTITRLDKDLSACGLLANSDYIKIENFLEDNVRAMDGLAQGKVYVGFALKQPDHLRGRNGNGKGVIGWLKNNDKYIADANIIIIDDESDNATQNTVRGEPDWSEDAVMRYANNLKNQKITAAKCVALWLEQLIVEKKDTSAGSSDRIELESQEDVVQSSFDEDDTLRKVLNENELDGVAVSKIIRYHARVLKLENRRIRFQKSSEPRLLSPFIEEYYCAKDITHSRAKDFRAILKWYLDVRKVRSEVNKAIIDLVDPNVFRCSKLAYVGYTASPYANFLNEQQGEDNPLELDFAQSMEIAQEYFGLQKIFGADVKSADVRMPIVQFISNEEKEKITKPFMDGNDIGLDTTLHYDYKIDGGGRESGSWESLKAAIKWAIVSAAIRRENRIVNNISDTDDETRSNRWTTMLVNISRKINDHGGLRDAIQNYLAYNVGHNNVARFRQECLVLFDELVASIDAARFSQLFPDYSHAVRTPCRADVEKHFDYVLKHIRVIALNSDIENITSYREYTQDVPQEQKLSGDWLWVVVGGNRISRGLTFDGLVSSYFDRDGVSVNVDTLLQMGRWFGYRVGYELLPRVWMPQEAVKSMKEICLLEEDMHAQLSSAFNRHGEKPNPNLLAISRRLTSRDNGKKLNKGVENGFVVREFRIPSLVKQDGVAMISCFLRSCGNSCRMKFDDKGKIYTRLNKWLSVDIEKIEKLSGQLGAFFSEKESERFAIAISHIKECYEKKLLEKGVDVVLSNPQNHKSVVNIEGLGDIFISEITNYEHIEDKCVRYGKFDGQYDAWKAVVPIEIVESIEMEFGSRANSDEAIAEMFIRRRNGGIPNKAVLQVGFIDVLGTPTPYVSIYCPGEDCLSPDTISADIVVGSGVGNSKDDIVTQALHSIRKYLESNKKEQMLLSDFYTATQGAYNGQLDQYGKDLAHSRFSDCSEQQKQLFRNNGLELVAEQDGRRHRPGYAGAKTCIRILRDENHEC